MRYVSDDILSTKYMSNRFNNVLSDMSLQGNEPLSDNKQSKVLGRAFLRKSDKRINIINKEPNPNYRLHLRNRENIVRDEIKPLFRGNNPLYGRRYPLVPQKTTPAKKEYIAYDVGYIPDRDNDAQYNVSPGSK